MQFGFGLPLPSFGFHRSCFSQRRAVCVRHDNAVSDCEQQESMCGYQERACTKQKGSCQISSLNCRWIRRWLNESCGYEMAVKPRSQIDIANSLPHHFRLWNVSQIFSLFCSSCGASGKLHGSYEPLHQCLLHAALGWRSIWYRHLQRFC
jgi:hypothetical protein